MTISGLEAWVTSAAEKKDVERALVLAGSIRRTLSTKKLAILTSSCVYENESSRARLAKAFDLVVNFAHKGWEGLSPEDHAKMEGFSLVIFDKCVYLSPNTMVMSNCDDIFDKYGDFAVGIKGNEVDSSVYMFTPSMEHKAALESVVNFFTLSGNGDGVEVIPMSTAEGTGFGKCFQLWLENHIPKWDQLDEEYHCLINLNGESVKSLSSKVVVAKFGELHPLDLALNWDSEDLPELGPIEKFVVDQCRIVYAEDVAPKTNLHYVELSPQLKDYKSEPIAIVGMSFRLPGANNVEEFWELLSKGKDAITILPQSRWLPGQVVAHVETRNVQAGFLQGRLDEFDYKFFGISGKEAEYMDPQHRLLHEVAWEALEDALIDPHSLRGTQTGVFVGSWLQDYKEIMSRSVDEDLFRAYVGNSIGSGAARLSHFFQTVGPCIATESGCSSAMVAVDMACKSLRNRDSNLALACGVNLILSPFSNNVLNAIFSPEGRCKTFDEGANGFGRAEGCAVLLMKRLSDASRDGDNIWGLIRGSAVTQEGTSTSFGTPTVHCESLAMELALKDAHVDPLDVSYVEAHGTGTPVGDPLEIAAITRAYSKGRSEPLVIGSVKTNVGHTEAVSGLAGIIKVILSMRNEMIPPHLHLTKLNPAINLDVIPATIPLEEMAWTKRNGKPRIAGVSSFGITGTDGHVIMQEPPVIPQPQLVCNGAQPRPLHLMKISAKSPESLEAQWRIYEELFNAKDDETNLDRFEDTAYSANIGRATLNHRAVIIAKDFREAAQIIRTKSFKSTQVQSPANRLCFLFTGQTAPYPNMSAELYATSPIFRDEFDKCNKILKRRYEINLAEVLWGEAVDNQDNLRRALYCQTGIFCVEYCLMKLWESWGVKPDFVLGHSLGEFAAAVTAGVLDLEDALIMLVAGRVQSIDILSRGKMFVIYADKKAVDQTIQKYKQDKRDFWVDYAALNSPVQTVIAGEPKMIEEFAKFCDENSIKGTLLSATHAFHSRHMEPMLESYGRVAETVTPLRAPPDSPRYVSALEGKVIESESINANYWVRHARETVNFAGACTSLHSEGCTIFLEIGPHPVLSALAMANFDGQSITCLPSIRKNQGNWVTMLESLAKLYLSDWKGQVDWNGFDGYYSRSRVSLPFYPFNRIPAWKTTEVAQPSLHPLLGKAAPTGCDHTIYENRITLKNTPFVQDHVIGNTVVFPGAGFMEMCLAGGHASAQGSFNGELLKPRRPVALQSLKIISPLGLYDSEAYQLQTSSKLETDEEGEMYYNIEIQRFVPLGTAGGGEWISHATAKFLPVPQIPSMKGLAPANVDIQSIQSSWGSVELGEFYGRLPDVGLYFGPKFQSLEMGWKSGKGCLLALKAMEENDPKYIIHPIISDAMIQAVMLWTGKDKLAKMKLQVPVQIVEFIMYEAASISESRYVYCETNEQGKTHCTLLDEGGSPLARMSGVDFIETTVKLVEGMIQKQGTATTKLWREVWRSTPGALQRAYNYPKTKDVTPFIQYSEEDWRFLESQNDIGEYEKAVYENLCHLTRSFFLNAMYELGWRPEQDKKFHSNELIMLLPYPEEHFKRYIRFFLRSLAETGMLIVDPEDGNYRFPEAPPTLEELNTRLKSVINANDSSRVDHQLVTTIGRCLSKVWHKRVEPLQLLFPDDPSKANASQFYDAESTWVATGVRKVADLVFARLDEFYASYKKVHGTTEPVLRVLEIGSGTGGFSIHYLENLERWGKPFQFYYTDISASFFTAAEKRLEKYLSHVIFKKFDMEVNPFAQGFCPNYFDMIMAGEVLHIAKDIRKMIGNIKGLLKPGGMIQVIEPSKPDPRETQIFGILEGYWGFQDLDFRPDHITLTPGKWEQAFRENNFDSVDSVQLRNNCRSVTTARLSSNDTTWLNTSAQQQPKHSWLILYAPTSANLCEELKLKLVGVNRKVSTVRQPATCTEEGIKELLKTEFHSAKEGVERVEGIIYLWGLPEDIDSRDQGQVSLPLLTLVQEVSTEFKVPPRIYVITQGTASPDGYEVTNPTAGTLQGMIKSFSNETHEIQLSWMDLPPDQSTVSHVEDIFHDLWNTDKSTSIIAFRDRERLTPKLICTKANNNEPLPLPSGCDRFQLLLPTTRQISDLEFVALEKYVLEENEVEVEVKAVALNFRDVFVVLKPIPLFEEMNSVGLDVAGVVTKVGSNVSTLKVGDHVIGINGEEKLSMPSHIKTDQAYLAPLPPSMTFQEGVTLPAVGLTAIQCLMNIAEMKKGDIVLIHTASGGVGLCAIQIAKQVGAEVIATAGSKRKQNYLRNLGIKHVFHSRTTQFGKQILEVTNGRGVDIVLNSITGEGFKEASLSALAKNGKFIEMSKLNVWKPEEIAELRPDVFYKVMDLTAMDKTELLQLMNQLKEFLAANNIKPIPYERFDALNIRGALSYLQKAKHIGKIVCVMPEAKIKNSKVIATTNLFNGQSTYLVTGGLGGIGFEVVKWMLRSGAKHVAILSRNSPKPDIASTIETWNKDGKHVKAFPIDIGDYDQCRQLFQELKSIHRGFPRIRGVMHAAGVLADATFENQNWSKFLQTYNPKVNGAWNLHELTKDLLLEHFVMFSSMAASFGTPGQANHAASNSFEDSLAAYRRSIGLPATSVNWGNWGEVGVATEVDVPGVHPISTSQGILTLETILKTQESQLCACNIDSFAVVVKLFPTIRNYVDDKLLFRDVKGDFIINSEDFWADVDAEVEREGKLVVFKNTIKFTLQTILKMNREEVIDDLTDFQTLGVDSLMLLEMKNGLQNILGSRMTVNANQLKDCNNTEVLADRLVSSLLGEWDYVKTILPTMEELQELIAEDATLPDHIRPSEGMVARPISEVETVFVTGATGSCGPYILKELCYRPGIKRIICLIRKFGKGSPKERLLNQIKAMDLEGQVDMDKVECVQGDVTEDKFGLPEAEYDRLAGSTDAVINSAVKADHTAKYFKAPDGMKHDLRNVNVLGTARILEFAVHTKLKHVFHGSSILSVFTTDDGDDDEDCYDLENENSYVSERFQALDVLPYNLGYPLSKFVSELLCSGAVERGIPCKAFRFPLIGGDSRNGRCGYRGSHVVLRWLTFLKLKCIPDELTPIMVIPVDQCAQLSLDVFFNPRASSGVYNVIHTGTAAEHQIMIDIASEFGIEIKTVTLHEFIDRLKLDGDDSPLGPFMKLYREDEKELFELVEQNTVVSSLRKMEAESKNFWKSRKLAKLDPNYADKCEPTEVVVRRDIHYLKESGAFEKFRIK